MGKRNFREHVGTSPGAECPRQDQIEDRRAFIASLGGVLVGAVLAQGCGDDEKPAGSKDTGPKPHDSGGIPAPPDAARDAGPPDHSGGLPDGPWAPKDGGYPDLYGGLPDAPGTHPDKGPPWAADMLGIPPDLPAPKDQQPPKKEMMPAGLPPMPDK